jgi:hypothetical protein
MEGLNARDPGTASDGVTDLVPPSNEIHPAFAHLLAASKDPEARRRRKRQKWDLLVQHESIIREIRSGDDPLTYRQISELLAAQGVKISHQVIARFCQAHQKEWISPAAGKKPPRASAKRRPPRPG